MSTHHIGNHKTVPEPHVGLFECTSRTPDQKLRSEPRRRPVTNDMDLIEDLIRTAIQPGYMVAIRGQWVFRIDGPQDIVACPVYEMNAVHQLIDTKWLKIGDGCYQRTADRESVEVNRILVPKSTRIQSLRWATLKPLGH